MKKYLGQHFLVNKKALELITEALDLKKDETVIEIGPGKGALTFDLSKTGAKVIAIEKDEELVNFLRNSIETQLKSSGNSIEILEGDALKILTTNNLQLTTNYKVVGNIPYYITGKLLRTLSELTKKPDLIILTIQREVAERITAKPPKMNLLAAITQFWAEPEVVSYLKPEDFDPAPEVHSAIIRLRPKNNLLIYEINRLESEKYFEFVKVLFKQPRKTILNNLRDGLDLEKEGVLKILAENGIQENERAQNLDVEQIIKLAKAL